MADQTDPNLSVLRKLAASVHQDLVQQAAFARDTAVVEPGPSVRQLLGDDYRRLRLIYWWMRLRRLTYVAGAIAGLVLLAMVALWLRLGNGPIEFDVATPWLTAAI